MDPRIKSAGDGEHVAEADDQPRKPGAFYGRRKGHPLRERQAALMQTLLPKLTLDLAKPAPDDLRALFTNAGEVRLESGFGGGEHLIAEAERHPRTGFLGIEPFVNGMAKVLVAIDERSSNIRLYYDDATTCSTGCRRRALARFDLLYPDPWPKRRHWKRRFVQDDIVAEIARIVRPAANSASPAILPITSRGP